MMTSSRNRTGDALALVTVMLGMTLTGALLTGCSRHDADPAAPPAVAPADDTRAARILANVKALAADEMEGRAPGTQGEIRAVTYLVDQFKKLGLEPGNPDGTYVQAVPLMAFTGKPTASFAIKGRRFDLASPGDYVAVSRRGQAQVSVTDSDLVFVGYGVVAPEFGWDDYKGLDVRGKTLVMLIGDPPVADPKAPSVLDATMFKGAAMTYYGRWVYKFEIAAEKGAAAAIIVHETGPAGYPFDVVQRWAGENYGEASGNLVQSHAAVDAWMTLDRAKQLFADSGHELMALKAQAATRAFRPVSLGAKVSFTVENTIRQVASQNVIAKLGGSDPALRDEAVMYSAHWDYFGRNSALQGDQIFNGALDNGSGMAELLAIAEGFAQMRPRPKRSILFLLPTAEEAGLLGARHYATNPSWPLERTLAVINMDIMNFWGRAHAIVSVGYGMTTLDEVLVTEAAKQDRIVLPDPEAEKGYFYRSDHFELVKKGVPALHFLHPGAEYRNKPADYGKQMRDRYTTNDYHKVSDDVKADWDLRGAIEDVDLLTAVGRAVANADNYPEWKPGTEFKARRDQALKAYRLR
jgi:Zn-dependent M28 family amino/carboxypeptidase